MLLDSCYENSSSQKPSLRRLERAWTWFNLFSLAVLAMGKAVPVLRAMYSSHLLSLKNLIWALSAPQRCWMQDWGQERCKSWPAGTLRCLCAWARNQDHTPVPQSHLEGCRSQIPCCQQFFCLPDQGPLEAPSRCLPCVADVWRKEQFHIFP